MPSINKKSHQNHFLGALEIIGGRLIDKLLIYQKSYYILLNSAFLGWLSVESQPQNPEFRINPVNFHPCVSYLWNIIL